MFIDRNPYLAYTYLNMKYLYINLNHKKVILIIDLVCMINKR
jgi:hypothetical protein